MIVVYLELPAGMVVPLSTSQIRDKASSQLNVASTHQFIHLYSD
jgi:hypothetical protein